MMKKYCILIGMLALTACTEKKDENYYLQHPQALKTALADCKTKTTGLSCAALADVQKTYADLSLSIQASPQQFGEDILDLQQKIAALKNSSKTEDKADRNKELASLQKALAQRLIMVKLFESPE